MPESPLQVKAKRVFSSRVQEAREALRDRAMDIFEAMLAVTVEARANKNYEVAAETLKWLYEHMPADAEGNRVIDSSAAKAKEIETNKGPQIAIGIQLGGMGTRELPAAKIIDITPINETS